MPVAYTFGDFTGANDAQPVDYWGVDCRRAVMDLVQLLSQFSVTSPATGTTTCVVGTGLSSSADSFLAINGLMANMLDHLCGVGPSIPRLRTSI